jgi:hypothetical protein
LLLGSTGRASITSKPARLTRSQLANDLAAGARITHVPVSLNPPLSAASGSMPIIDRDGCNVPRLGVRSQLCSFADKKSHTTIVVFGDSHAGAWFPALQQISEQQGWRLVDVTKDGCSAAEINIAAWFRNGAPYWECTQWRNTALAQIAHLHPTAVIVSEARYLEEPETTLVLGGPTDQTTTWLNGLASTFTSLQGSAKRVIFISDTPTLTQRAPMCVSGHESDVRSCTTSRGQAILLPEVRAAEFALAQRDHITAIDPTSWFCTPTTCPVIAHNIVIYRDNAHMVPAWSRFLAPLLAGAVVPVVRAALAGVPAS